MAANTKHLKTTFASFDNLPEAIAHRDQFLNERGLAARGVKVVSLDYNDALFVVKATWDVRFFRRG